MPSQVDIRVARKRYLIARLMDCKDLEIAARKELNRLAAQIAFGE